MPKAKEHRESGIPSRRAVAQMGLEADNQRLQVEMIELRTELSKERASRLEHEEARRTLQVQLSVERRGTEEALKTATKSIEESTKIKRFLRLVRDLINHELGEGLPPAALGVWWPLILGAGVFATGMYALMGRGA